MDCILKICSALSSQCLGSTPVLVLLDDGNGALAAAVCDCLFPCPTGPEQSSKGIRATCTALDQQQLSIHVHTSCVCIACLEGSLVSLSDQHSATPPSVTRFCSKQVKYIEAVNTMVQQLLCRLCTRETQSLGGRQYAVCVTSDHSTPVERGDHSHEPVPFSISHVRWVPTHLPPSLQLASLKSHCPIRLCPPS